MRLLFCQLLSIIVMVSCVSKCLATIPLDGFRFCPLQAARLSQCEKGTNICHCDSTLLAGFAAKATIPQAIVEVQKVEAKTLDKVPKDNTELTVLNEQKTHLPNWAMALVVSFLLATIGFLLYWTRRRITMIRKQLKSQQHQFERERQLRTDAEQRLVRMQRMESLGSLAGGIAHDFNNLLVGVLGNAELLARSNDTSKEFVVERAKQIIQASEKAADLSRQMLAYSGQGVRKQEDIELNKQLMNLEAVLNSKGDSLARVHVEKSASEVFVRGNATQIDQVVMNLVSNAQSASNVNDEVVISVGRQEIDEDELKTNRCLFGRRTNGGEFGYIEVSDSGHGIAESEVEKIFDPFFGNSDGGRGLGLAVVYGLVSGHNGLVNIDSKVGVGTKMRVLIPVVAAEDVQGIPPPTLDNMDDLEEPLKVLVVDDEQSILEWIERLGDIEKIDIETAKNGGEVVEIYSSITVPDFTCVVLDLMMPDMDGVEVLNWLESKSIDVPVVVMSGRNQGQLRHMHKFRNVMGVIEKPFSATDLLSIVRRSRIWSQLSD